MRVRSAHRTGRTRILQQHDKTLSFSPHEIVEGGGLPADVRGCNGLDQLLLLLRDRETLERFRIPFNVADVADSKLHCIELNQLQCAWRRRRPISLLRAKTEARHRWATGEQDFVAQFGRLR